MTPVVNTSPIPTDEPRYVGEEGNQFHCHDNNTISFFLLSLTHSLSHTLSSTHPHTLSLFHPPTHPQDLAHALRTKLEQSRRFEVPRRPQHAFVIDHYAGKVCYSTDALLDKNKDFVVAEQTALLTASTLPIIAAMFEPPKEREPAPTGAT